MSREDEPGVALLMFIAYRAAETRVFRALADAGFGSFSPAQARVAQRVGPNGSRLTELAEAAMITKQSAGFLVDQLERAGYVERVPDPSDARAKLVRLTPLATATQAIADAEVASVEAEWTDYLGEQRMTQLREIMTKLREITDPYM